jgi:Tol biopolymer transport system component
MLSGRRAFDGETVTDLLAAVVTRDPDWSALPPATPPHVRALLTRCLVRDPRQRLRDIGDARIELTKPFEDAAPDPAPLPARPPRVATPWLPWTIAAIATTIAAAVLFVAWRSRDDTAAGASLRPQRFIVHPPEGGLEIPGSIRAAGSATIAPDGRRLALLATAPDGRLWIRDFSATEPTLIKGTGGAQQPFWSPDGRTLGFFGVRTLRKLDLESGAIQDIGPSVGLGGLRGGTFGPDGTVLFKDDTRPGISRLSPGATSTTAATELDTARGDLAHEWPVFLPDGRQFLFLGRTKNAETSGIYLGSLDSAATRLVTRADSNAAYASGYLLYARAGMLLAQSFDIGNGNVSGEPVTIEPRIVFNPSINRGEFSVSQTGVLAHATNGLNIVGLGWFDRSGVKLGDIDAQGHMDIASDDRRVAADRVDPQTGLRDVWVFDVAGGQRTRLSFSAATDWVPVFSPDGTTVVYTSDRDTPGVAQLYQKAANGSGAETLLLETGSPKHHLDWSPDGRFLAFEQNDEAGFQDLWMLPMTGERTPVPFLQSPFREAQPSFSPDSRLLAYASNESGVFEVYVQTFPASGGRWQISTAGGTNPMWRRDGREMFYLSADGRIMALDVELKTPSFAAPRALFQTAIAGDTTTDHFAVTSDGQRFLVQASTEGSRMGYAVVLNWMADLRK